MIIQMAEETCCECGITFGITKGLHDDLVKCKNSFYCPKGHRQHYVGETDAPWNYADQGCQGTMANHYKGMKIEDICALPVSKIADDNCVLFLWATYPMYEEALQVIKSWEFTYKTLAFQWLKLNPNNWGWFYGLGRWTRGNTEPCLLATKGKPKRIATDVFQLIDTPRMRHSRKPNETRKRIIRLMGDLPRIELFARQKTEGWDVWGNEVESDIELRCLKKE